MAWEYYDKFESFVDNIKPPRPSDLERYNANLADPERHVIHQRYCPFCGEVWHTAEMPLIHGWAAKSPLYCLDHPNVKSKIQKTIRRRDFLGGNYLTKGVVKVMAMNGVYRRRVCRDPGCDQGKGRAKDGRMRWSTVEVVPNGLYDTEATSCPKCKEGELQGKLIRV